MRFVNLTLILLMLTLAGCSSTLPLSTPAISSLPSPEVSPESFPRIEDQYPGYVHKDSFELNAQNYEVYYWNNGEFDYTQFLIAKNREIVFDSQQAALKPEGGMISDRKEEVWAKALLQNSRPTFQFELADNRPESATIVIEEIDGEFQVTVNDNVLLIFEDVDQDEQPELLASPYSGQVPLGPALFAVYELRGNQYVPDKDRTLQYYEDQLPHLEQNFKTDPTESNLEALLDVYLILERIDKAQAKFPEFYNWAGQTAGDGGFVDTYNRRIQEGSYDQIDGWMSKLTPLKHSHPSSSL
ncbi:hypothetical protein [Paenibacillus sp. sgz5001063]|uniref:hypothetical protein n=1 Tax=Paenibacillus sp. sgz5001063 TaxID=3242474 RepID=UPI0036D2B620